ncbi:hypothetical protein [Aliamphritea spongicola]|uniref:hypothetical protein n=1 Tax=Aliamphritea spongicola TaxID=707589 RepID=UPI00196B0419|nr:hypothetical protein [Aliamphritea spongicola]MBN3562507.1 hypothetical protein [Aliamphritea spongicola]
MAIDDRDYYKKQLIEKLDKLEADERRSAKGLKGRFRESRLAYEKDDVQSRPSPPPATMDAIPDQPRYRKAPWSLYEIILYLAIIILGLKFHSNFKAAFVHAPDQYLWFNAKIAGVCLIAIVVIRCTKTAFHKH